GAARVVERKQLRGRERLPRAIVGALEPLRKSNGSRPAASGGLFSAVGCAAVRNEEDTVAVALTECRSNGVRDASARRRFDDRSVDDDEQLPRAGEVERGGADLLQMV